MSNMLSNKYTLFIPLAAGVILAGSMMVATPALALSPLFVQNYSYHFNIDAKTYWSSATTAGGSAANCTGNSPGAGYTLSHSECLTTTGTGVCTAMACLWATPTAQNYQHGITIQGTAWDRPAVGACGAQGTPGAGWILVSDQCYAYSASGCFARMCFWQAPNPDANTSLQYHFTHAGAASPAHSANCASSANPGNPWQLVGHAAYYTNGNNVTFGDFCFWRNTISTSAAACTTNSDCGTNAYAGGNFCQGNSVYRNFTTYTCNNPGQANAFCSNSTAAQLQSTCAGNQTCSGGSCVNQTIACSSNSQCGTDAFTGGNFCQGNAVYRNFTTYTCNNAGTTSSFCSNNTAAQLQSTCSSGQTCSGGSCNANQTITCNSNTDCGSNAYTGGNFCQGNAVYRNFITYTCNNAGTASSFCSNNTSAQLQNTCSSGQTCSGGSCTTTNTCTPNASLRCQNNALYWYDSCGNQGSLSQLCTNGCSNGSNACNNAQTTGLTVTTLVRNLSAGNLNWTSSVNTAPGDILQFQVTAKNTGTVTINNIVIRDTLPANLIYKNALTIDGVANGGNITLGVNIGSLNASQTRIMTYQVQVASAGNFAYGTTTLNNAITVTGDNTNSVNSSAAVVVTRTSIGNPGDVSTGLTNNIWVDSFFIPLALALGAFWLWKAKFAGKSRLPKWLRNS